jgi:hypothetical protein
LLFALGVSTPAFGAVTSVEAGGFVLTHQVRTPVTPTGAYRAFLNIGAWWSDAHTYSGAARNLKIDARPGGCWCEKLDGGGFERHMMLEYAQPGKALRILGGLGPLQEMGAAGAQTVQFAPADSGGTMVTVRYAVNGRDAGSWRDLAPVVDRVLGEQLTRFGALWS